MKKYVLYIFLIGIFPVIIFSCIKDSFNFNIDCDECYYNRPDSSDLVVNLTINSENPSVPLVFYKGKVEDGIIEWVDTATTSTLYLLSPVNKFYSVKAVYKSGEKKIIAIDGDKLKTRQVSGVCDRDCWVIYGGILDVRLKYK